MEREDRTMGPTGGAGARVPTGAAGAAVNLDGISGDAERPCDTRKAA
jgi:hypothetical protein